MVPPPTPFHVLRNHAAPLSTVSFNTDNKLLYAGDQEGNVSITDLRTRRTTSLWAAHDGGVLSVEEWNGRLISHGRDNYIHIHHPTPTHGSLSTGPGPSRPPLSIDESLTTNSLNFCRFSLCPAPRVEDKARQDLSPKPEALLAVPNLVDSELVDIYLLPSRRRLHASLNFLKKPKEAVGDSVRLGEGRTGLIMSLHLAFDGEGRLNCVMAFEDGRLEVWRCGPASAEGSPSISSGQTQCTEGEEAWKTKWDGRMSIGPALWNKVYEAKGHNEAVMAMTVDRDLKRAFTVSADHLIVRYDISSLASTDNLAMTTPGYHAQGIKSFSTGQIGNASLAVSHDGKVVAVGGWDGRIRLFSAASLKPLGTLSYHRETVHTLAFANPPRPQSEVDTEETSTLELGQEEVEDGTDEEEEGVGGSVPRERWLASGGKDKRIALWGLKDFSGV